MSGRYLDNLQEGLLREISEDIFDLNRNVQECTESIRVLNKASTESLEAQHRQVTNYILQATEQLDEHIAKRKYETDEDIKEAFNNNSQQAVAAFQTRIEETTGSVDKTISRFESSLEGIRQKCEAIEQHGRRNTVPKWAKLVIGMLALTCVVTTASAFYMGMSLQSNNTVAMMEFIKSLDQKEIDSLLNR